MTNLCPLCNRSPISMQVGCCDTCGEMMNGKVGDQITSQISLSSPIIPSDVIDNCSVAVSRSLSGTTSWCSSDIKKKKLKYYEEMGNWIDNIEVLENIDINSPLPIDKNEAPKTIRVATYLSFLINLFLLLAKSIAISSSISYTIISSLVDSCLDLIAGMIISCTAAHSKFTLDDLKKYPLGKSRIPVVGILVFSILMACCALYIAIQCIMSLIEHEPSPPTTHTAIHVMWWTIFTKLAMTIVYSLLDHPITDTLAEDHRNDVLTNSLGLFMYWGGAHFYWWMDSVGGIILSAFVLQSWVQTALENAQMLMGQSAPDELIRSITYVAASHHPLIIGVEQVIAFQVGPNFMAEVHIILPDNLPLRITHHIGETLQLKIERIPEIERAWVHIDTETHNDCEHVLTMRTSNSIPSFSDNYNHFQSV